MPESLVTEAPPSLAIQLILWTDMDENLDGTSDFTARYYYGTSGIPPTQTLPEFLAEGGLYLQIRDTTGVTAEYVLAAIAEMDPRPPPPTVRVGDHLAVLVHADPILRDDLRPWNLYWSDGTFDYSIEAGVSAVDVINTARRIECD